MSEQIRALIYILAIIIPVLFVAQMAVKPFVEDRDFAVWRNCWVAATIAVFTTGDILLLIGCLLLIAGYVYASKAESKYLFIVMMFTIPSVEFTLGVFGVINKLLDMNGARFLSVIFLLPAAFLIISRSSYGDGNVKHSNAVFFSVKKEEEYGVVFKGVDYLVLLYVFFLVVLSVRVGDINHTLRMIFTYAIDILLPYFVFSRTIHTYREVRKTLAAFVVGILPLAAIGIFETARSWRVYSSVIDQWGITQLTPYLYRDGLLRAAASSVEAITFAFCCMAAIGCLIGLRGIKPKSIFVLAAYGILAVALLASLSRGPWVGTVVLFLVFVVTGPRIVSNVTKAALASLACFGLLSLTPYGERLYRLLPFVGSIQEETEQYRLTLIENSITLIKRNPYFGAADYLQTPQMQAMLQGQGIIDVVNTYAAIALEFGLVTLATYVAIFLIIGLRLAALCYKDVEDATVVKAVTATMAAMLFTIATVSSISAIPYIHWTIAGLSVAIVRASRTAVRSKSNSSLPKLKVLGHPR